MTSKNKEVIQFMEERRSVPAKIMGGPGPSDEEVLAMVKIASRVPDHGKLTPWRFVHYSQKACRRINEAIIARAMEKYANMSDEMIEIEKTRFSRSPTIIGVISKVVESPKVPSWEQQLSAGAATMNLLIAANAYGYDAQWLTEWLAFDEELRETLGLAESEQIAGFVHIGTKTMPKTLRDRPDLNEIYSKIES